MQHFADDDIRDDDIRMAEHESCALCAAGEGLAHYPEPEPLTLTVTTFTNGFGDWRARVDFSHTLSESDPREEFNLDAQWSRIRRAARRAIVREIAEREQTTRETLDDANRRVSASLPRLDVIEQHVLPSLNTWHGVTIGEHYERSVSSWQ